MLEDVIGNHMDKIVIVGISDMKIIKDSGRLETYALSSCIATCIYDELMKIGGMSHILLPATGFISNNCNLEVFKYANTAIIEMVNDMEKMGASRYRMKAKIVGGSQMQGILHSNNMSIGVKNIQQVKLELKKLHIPIISEDVGSSYARSVFFDVDSGEVKVKIANKTEIYI